MAQKFVSFAYQHHGRSNSFPSHSQPVCNKTEIELNRFKTWKSSSSLSLPGAVSSETIQTGLVGLAELYNCVQELLECPKIQQTISKHQHEKIVEEVLEGSVKVLDSWGTIKELLSAMKDNLQDLQSALRRKGGDSSISSNINAYINLRKRVKRDVIKSLRTLRKLEKDVDSCPLIVEDQQLSLLIRLLRGVAATTISTFRSMLLFLSMPDLKLKVNGWSFISKLITSRATANGRDQKIANEVGSVDIIVHSLLDSKNSKIDVQMIVRRLQSLDSTIQDLESGMDGLSRRLIQNRVALLNIITC